jgi:hypothetical protein
MGMSDKRLFDAVLIVLGCVVLIVVADVRLLHGATSVALAMGLILWLTASLPVAVLIGHCALSEE